MNKPMHTSNLPIHPQVKSQRNRIQTKQMEIPKIWPLKSIELKDTTRIKNIEIPNIPTLWQMKQISLPDHKISKINIKIFPRGEVYIVQVLMSSRGI